METDFSALRQALHAARLQAYGRDHTSIWVRTTLDRLVNGVLSAQNGLPTASFTFLRQLSTPAYTVGFDTVSWSFAGTLTVVQPAGDEGQGNAQGVDSAARSDESAIQDLEAVVGELQRAINDELAIRQ